MCIQHKCVMYRVYEHARMCVVCRYLAPAYWLLGIAHLAPALVQAMLGYARAGPLPHTHTHTHARTHAHTYTRTRAHTHTHARAHTYTRTRAHTHRQQGCAHFIPGAQILLYTSRVTALVLGEGPGCGVVLLRVRAVQGGLSWAFSISSLGRAGAGGQDLCRRERHCSKHTHTHIHVHVTCVHVKCVHKCSRAGRAGH